MPFPPRKLDGHPDTAIKVTDGAQHRRPAPALGADNEAVLRDLLGYSAAQIEELRQSGAI